MSNEILLNTDVFETIVNSITFSAGDCLLYQVIAEGMTPKTKTNIMSFLDGNSDELRDAMSKFQGHSAGDLPSSLDRMKQSFVNLDQAAADAIKAKI